MTRRRPPRPTTSRARARSARPAYYLIDRPLIMLSVILVLLLIACEITSPGYMSAGRIGAILQFSAPLAFLAAGQTLVMLTAGIDLSVAATATAAAYIMAGQASRGTGTAVAIAILVGPRRRPHQRRRRRHLPRQPADHDARHGEHRQRLPDRLRAVVRHRRAARARASCASWRSAT